MTDPVRARSLSPVVRVPSPAPASPASLAVALPPPPSTTPADRARLQAAEVPGVTALALLAEPGLSPAARRLAGTLASAHRTTERLLEMAELGLGAWAIQGVRPAEGLEAAARRVVYNGLGAVDELCAALIDEHPGGWVRAEVDRFRARHVPAALPSAHPAHGIDPVAEREKMAPRRALVEYFAGRYLDLPRARSLLGRVDPEWARALDWPPHARPREVFAELVLAASADELRRLVDASAADYVGAVGEAERLARAIAVARTLTD